MPTGVDLHGPTAIHIIVSKAHPMLSKLWDGAAERVGFIEEKSDAIQVTFFPNRAFAIRELRSAALWLPDALARDLRKLLDGLETAPPARGVECIIAGWGAYLCIEIEPEDLRAGPRVGLSNEDVIDAVIAGRTQKSALGAVGDIRSGLSSAGVDLAELVDLEHAISEKWDNASALALALARAGTAAEGHLEIAAGQRARLVLMLLGDEICNRSGAVNARGGDA